MLCSVEASCWAARIASESAGSLPSGNTGDSAEAVGCMKATGAGDVSAVTNRSCQHGASSAAAAAAAVSLPKRESAVIASAMYLLETESASSTQTGRLRTSGSAACEAHPKQATRVCAKRSCTGLYMTVHCHTACGCCTLTSLFTDGHASMPRQHACTLQLLR